MRICDETRQLNGSRFGHICEVGQRHEFCASAGCETLHAWGVWQATIQGALGGLPLDLVNAHMAGLPQAEYTAYKNWASDILNTGVLAIVICAPLGLLIIGARRGRSGCTCVKVVRWSCGASWPLFVSVGGPAPCVRP